MTAPVPSDLLVIAASNGANLQLAERFAAAASARGLSAAVLDLTSLDLPLFTPRTRDAGTPPALAGLQAQLVAAPRWVICTPEYNGSIPPVLTSAIAWLSVQGDDFRALFNGRPVVIATHSGSGGHTLLAALRLQLAHLGALAGWVLLHTNWRPTTWAPRWASWSRSAASTVWPPLPEWVAITTGRPLNRARKSSPCTDNQAMALVSTGGIEPLYSGVQITQRGAATSWACSPARAGGVPASRVRGVNSGRSRLVRSRTAALSPRAEAAAAKRSASCRLAPLLAAITSRSEGTGAVMEGLEGGVVDRDGMGTVPMGCGPQSGGRASL